MLPTMPVTRNYRVFLPDGYELIESHDHRRAISQVFYTPDSEQGAALGGRCGCQGYARGILVSGTYELTARQGNACLM